MSERNETVFSPLLSKIVGTLFIFVALGGAASAAILYFGWPF